MVFKLLGNGLYRIGLLTFPGQNMKAEPKVAEVQEGDPHRHA